MEQHQHSSDIGIAQSSAVRLGERLKKARELKSLTIDQVQKQTRINSKVIVALEEGRASELLPVIYVKSYMKKYSQFLGLDPAEAVKEYGLGHSDEVHVDISGLKPSTKESHLVSRFIHIVSFAILAVAIISLAVFAGGKLMTALKKPASKKIVFASSTKRATTPKAEVKVQKDTPVAIKASSPKTTSRQKNTSFNLEVKVKKPVVVQVKKDGEILFRSMLPKGTVERFSANDKIEIYVAKAESIELVLNGKSLGSPGKGTIRNLEITSRGVKIR